MKGQGVPLGEVKDLSTNNQSIKQANNKEIKSVCQKSLMECFPLGKSPPDYYYVTCIAVYWIWYLFQNNTTVKNRQKPLNWITQILNIWCKYVMAIYIFPIKLEEPNIFYATYTYKTNRD